MSNARPIISVVVIGVIALVGLLVVGSLAGVAADFGIDQTTDQIVGPDTGESYGYDLDEPERFEVKATQEVGVELDGAGHVSVSDGGAIGTGSWTTYATAALNGSETATYNILAYDEETALIEYDDGAYRAIYYDNGSSAMASVPATDPTTLTPIGATWNETAGELTIAADGQTDTATLTSESPNRSVALDWDGTLDEIRVLNATSDVGASPYLDDPIRPLDGDQHTVRLMFDEEQQTVTNYYGTDGSVTGGVFVEGVQQPTLVEGTDYETTTAPTSVTFVAGGYFDGAPVAWVEVESLGVLVGTIDSVVGGFGDALGLIPIVMIVILSSVVISVVQRTRR